MLCRLFSWRFIMSTENPFIKLFAIDFKDHLEVKKSGNTELNM